MPRAKIIARRAIMVEYPAGFPVPLQAQSQAAVERLINTARSSSSRHCGLSRGLIGTWTIRLIFAGRWSCIAPQGFHLTELASIRSAPFYGANEKRGSFV